MASDRYKVIFEETGSKGLGGYKGSHGNYFSAKKIFPQVICREEYYHICWFQMAKNWVTVDLTISYHTNSNQRIESSSFIYGIVVYGDGRKRVAYLTCHFPNRKIRLIHNL